MHTTLVRMKLVVDGLSTLFSRRDSRIMSVVVTLCFFTFLLFFQNGNTAYQVFSFTSFPLEDRIISAFTVLFDIQHTFSRSSLVISVLGSLLGGINVSLAYTYMKLRGQVILKSGLYQGLGLFLALFGIGCAACGTALMSVILSFLGVSAMIHTLPYDGQELGYIGIIFLAMATYTLARRVATYATC